VIRSHLNVLRARKEHAERRKLSYRDIAAETGLATSTLVRLFRFELDDGDRVGVGTLGTLCAYFGCGPGDILEFIADGSASDAAAAPIGRQEPGAAPAAAHPSPLANRKQKRRK